MGKRALHPDTYDLMLLAFRLLPGDQPGGCAAAAKRAGVERRVAKRAWTVGWPHYRNKSWHVPIRERIAEEVRQRALLEEAAKARAAEPPQPPPAVLSQSAQQEAAQHYREEMDLVRNVRIAGSASIAVVGSLLQPMRNLAAELGAQIQSGHFRDKPEKGIEVLRKFTLAMGRAVLIAETAQVMEHRRLGAIEDPLAPQGGGAREEVEEALSIPDYQREWLAAGNALKAVKEFGIRIEAADATLEAEGAEQAQASGDGA